MKAILLSMALALMGGQTILAQSHQVETTNEKNQRVIIEISDDPQHAGDTLSITTYDNGELAADTTTTIVSANVDSDYIPEVLSEALLEFAIAISICVFLPIVLVISILIYRYQSRKRKYALAEKLVESGQPLPNELMSELYGNAVVTNAKNAGNLRTLYDRGVRNVCIGIALFIFIALLTDGWGLACLALFVVANGVSQLLSYRHHNELVEKSYTHDTKQQTANNNTPNAANTVSTTAESQQPTDEKTANTDAE